MYLFCKKQGYEGWYLEWSPTTEVEFCLFTCENPRFISLKYPQLLSSLGFLAFPVTILIGVPYSYVTGREYFLTYSPLSIYFFHALVVFRFIILFPNRSYR